MTVEAKLADGTTLKFPDGTDPSVIQAAVQRIIAERNAAEPTAPMVRGPETKAMQFGRETVSGENQPPVFAAAQQASGPPVTTVSSQENFLSPVAAGFQVAPILASAAIAEPIAGVAGIAQSLNPFAEKGAGADAVAQTQNALTLKPRTPEAQAGVESTAKFIQPLADLLSRVNEVSGEIGFDLAGPIGGALGEALPTAVLEVLGISSAKPVTNFFTKQSPTKQRIAQKLSEGIADRDTAGFQLEAPKQKVEPDVLPDVGASPDPSSQQSIPDSIARGEPRARNLQPARDAIKQGFDEGTVAVVSGASDADKIKMIEMVDKMERAKANSLFAQSNRPSDVAGSSLLERVQVVRDANISAGKQLDIVAGSLRGQQADFSGAVNSFMDDLDSLGISLNDDLSPNFTGSDIEGLSAPESAIRRLANRMVSSGTPDAFEMHRLKRFIDEIVTFGKVGEGLTGRTEGIIKSLRRNLDQTLDATFPEYNRVNTQYSETIQALDGFQDAAGSRMDLSGGNADKAVGTSLRKLLSNTPSRVNLLDSINTLEDTARRYGGAFEDDLMTQILFVDELDSVFGPIARTSFQGQIRQAIPTTKAGAVQAAAEKAIESVRGINQDNAFIAIRSLLEQAGN